LKNVNGRQNKYVILVTPKRLSHRSIVAVTTSVNRAAKLLIHHVTRCFINNALTQFFFFSKMRAMSPGSVKILPRVAEKKLSVTQILT
jgi:hypothetical protein